MKFVPMAASLLILALVGCGGAKPTLIAGKPVDHWLKQLENPDAKERKNAVFKLEALGTADSNVLPALIGALKDSDATVRCEAIVAVARWGNDAGEAIPILTEMESNDPSTEVRDYAAKAVKKLSAAK
jgi:HEAT repeat protein